MNRFLLFLLISTTVGACSRAPSSPSTSTIDFGAKFLKRTVDLQPYLYGFPYNWITPNLESKELFFLKTTKPGLYLHNLSTKDGINLEKSHQISSINFNQRTFWQPQYNKKLDGIVVRGDEKNDEIIKLWFFPRKSGKSKVLTQTEYIYSFRFDESHEHIAYTSRHGFNPNHYNCLEEFNTSKQQNSRLFCDKDLPFKFSWGGIAFSPSANRIAFTLLADNDRTKRNLFFFDRKNGHYTLFSDKTVERSETWPLQPWVDENTIHYASDEDGFINLYRYNIAQKKRVQLTHNKSSIDYTAMLQDQERYWIAFTMKNGWDTVFQIVDPLTGKIHYKKNLSGTASFADIHGNQLLVVRKDASTPYEALLATISFDKKLKVNWKPYIEYPKTLKESLIHCDVERISYSSPDLNPKSGQPWKIPALLYTPKKPLPDPAQHLYLLLAFYGGYNSFSLQAQADCAVGISTLSPAVRGSWFHGKEFFEANDGENADAPVRDVIAGARYLKRRYSLKPQQMGTFGGSHGGWAAIRALTLPPQEKYRFPFGFALAFAGIYDLVGAHETVNIPGWIDKEFGNPKIQREQLMYHSPIHYADNLQVPVFLAHGKNDSRIPVAESRLFHAKLKKLKKDSTFLEIPGQGHSIRGDENITRYYRERYRFMERIVRSNEVN